MVSQSKDFNTEYGQEPKPQGLCRPSSSELSCSNKAFALNYSLHINYEESSGPEKNPMTFQLTSFSQQPQSLLPELHTPKGRIQCALLPAGLKHRVMDAWPVHRQATARSSLEWQGGPVTLAGAGVQDTGLRTWVWGSDRHRFKPELCLSKASDSGSTDQLSLRLSFLFSRLIISMVSNLTLLQG